MHRCIALAKLGGRNAAPNPMVGAVLVYNERIIGEGFHASYGHAHAEVNCIQSVRAADIIHIAVATLYVSLEPCAHWGKTPPCSDLIVQYRIPKVVVGCRDPFPLVDGKGIEKLRAAGVEVVVGVCEEECIQLNKRFFQFHQSKRPYIILKWAMSADGFIAGNDTQPVKISNERTDRIVHRWRTEEMGIMIGSGTAMADDPRLTARLWPGKNPVRIVLDRSKRLTTLAMESEQGYTLILRHSEDAPGVAEAMVAGWRGSGILYGGISSEQSSVREVLEYLYRCGIQSVLVEGGRRLLVAFIREGCWDEARIITATNVEIGEGISAPVLRNHSMQTTESFLFDRIDYYTNIKPN